MVDKVRCKHCDFIDKTFGTVLKGDDSSNREYWLMTKVFIYLHDGRDYCKIRSKLDKAREEYYELKSRFSDDCSFYEEILNYIRELEKSVNEPRRTRKF